MDPKAAFVWYLLALVCFGIAAFWDVYFAAPPDRNFRRINLIALGLALVDVVWMYSAYKAI